MNARALAACLTALLAVTTACRDADQPAAVVAADASLPLAAPRPVEGDPIAAALAAVPPRTGRCAQVRSLKEAAEAETVAEAMRKQLALPVEVQRADLGERGVWWRLCVGDEDSDARMVARATRWTGPGGELEPFLDAPVPGLPRFFVLERARTEPRRPAEPAARAVAAHRLPDAAVHLFGGPTADRLLVATTAPTSSGATDVLVVDAKGARLPLRPGAAPGCASCELSLRDGKVTARRAVAADDLAPHAGEELVLEEDTGRGARLLTVVAQHDGALARVAGLLLGAERPGFVVRGTAEVVEADADPQREVVLATTELRVQGDAGCALERHAELFDVTEGGMVRVDPLRLPPEPADALINAVTALDGAGDTLLASRVCAAHLARDARAALAQVCLDRVAALLAARRPIDAVNAGALIAEGAPSLRAAVAGPLLDAVGGLDKDVRLSAIEPDCAKDPLVPALAALTVDDAMAKAAARAAERVSLGALVDAVFVTGARDFGADTPVGLVTVKWLERLKVSLPARYAAVEALLLPPAPAPATVDGGVAGQGGQGGQGAQGGQGGAGFGGGPGGAP
ncbi:MAG: hypothetical protein HYS27_16040 [Deltaproteobacteria bacterium]|nr:hypothetical protein [Deltaproteobacteria bacterium]